MNPNKQEIQQAFQRLDEIVSADGIASDREYYYFHRPRFMRMARAVAAKAPKGAKILNIGSHYLHSSLVFQMLGYEVDSMDVAEFWELDFVKKRASEFNLVPIIENNLEHLNSIKETDAYDVILFAEIFEHITFNPVNFWKRIYTILKSSGFVYISTPNSMNLFNMARTVARVLTLRGVGIPIASIFSNVTYGHHWKEYSVPEIKTYFRSLSDDFKVHTSLYHYRKPKADSAMGLITALCSKLGNGLYFFSDEIEAIVKVEKTGSWKIEAPGY